MPASPEVTSLLQELSSGNREALRRLIPVVYDQLRQVAEAHFERERHDHTLQPTALVHEAYFRLVAQRRVRWQNRAHFISVAARLMRRVLIDHARRRRAGKRGGAQRLLVTTEELSRSAAPDSINAVDLIALDDALTRLTALDAQQGRIVELRFFGGLTVEETARSLDISPATVKRDWQVARAWLFREIRRTSA